MKRFPGVTGSTGDTLALTVVSITNPDFQPDMESTSSYGWYHSFVGEHCQKSGILLCRLKRVCGNSL